MIRYHCFLSYTNREPELQELRPLLDVLGHAFRSLGVVQAPFFWDRFQMDQQVDASDLATTLLSGIEQSLCLIAFLSPSYVSSPWCIFEWGAMGGVHLNRGPKWPAIKPYIWKQLHNPEHFVGQVPYGTVTVDFDVLQKYQPTSWNVRNPIAEHLYQQEKRKLGQFVGDLLSFISMKYGEMDESRVRDLRPDGAALQRMAEELSEGRPIEDVAARHGFRRMS